MEVITLKITKNNVGVEIELEEFLDVLESGLFDDMLMFILELDKGQAYDPEYDEGEYGGEQEFVDAMDRLNSIEDDDMVEYFQIGYIFEGPMAGHEMNSFISSIEEAIAKAHEAMEKDFDGEYELMEFDTSQPINFKRPKSSYSRNLDNRVSSSKEDHKVRTLLTKYEGM
jgi:hypothetical protein